jgi:adenylate cyclase
MAPIRIRSLLALTMGGLVLVASAAVLTVALFANESNTVELLNSRTVLIVDGIESEVRQKLDAASGLVQGLARAVQRGDLQTASPDDMQRALSIALSAAPDGQVLIYWSHDLATRRLVFRNSDGSIGRQGPEAEPNPQVRAGLAGMIPGSGQWGAPVVEGGVTYMNYAFAVDSATNDVAYLVAAVSLQQFSSYVADIGRRYGATAFMLYGKDKVLAHPAFVNRAGAAQTVVPIAEAGDPVLANLAKAKPARFLESARRQYVDTYEVEAGGSDYVIMYRWLYGYGPQPIAVGAYFPRTEVGDTLRRLRLSGLVGIGIGLLGVAAAIVLGGLIARPISRLAHSAAAVAELDFDAVPVPPPSWVAELNEQARAFRRMLEALRNFEAYVPRRLVRRLVALGGHATMQSETRELTVMFTDIVHFSAISERMGAEETAAFLNRQLGLVAACIDAEDGTIDKYIGDAVMAFWGAPDRMDDHAAAAIRAARRIVKAVTANNARRAQKGLNPVRLRVGIHTGSAVVGNIGTPERLNYTIVGDTVNDAQRLEALGHRLDNGADVIVLTTAETAARAGLKPDEVEDVGGYPLAGGDHLMPIRRLV